MADNKRDFYEVLGVEKTASADAIKKAYRKAAMITALRFLWKNFRFQRQKPCRSWQQH